MSVWKQFMKREDASSYIDKDADMPRVLRTKDFWHWELARLFRRQSSLCQVWLLLSMQGQL